MHPAHDVRRRSSARGDWRQQIAAGMAARWRLHFRLVRVDADCCATTGVVLLGDVGEGRFVGETGLLCGGGRKVGSYCEEIGLVVSCYFRLAS